jgi:hypothetical protein
VLRSTVDGGAEVVGSDGVVVTSVAPPWAVDANGASVSTRYRIEGTALVQVIDHHGAACPVVGDPCWSCWAKTAWKVARCTAAVAAFVAGNLSVAARVKKVGGVAKMVEKLRDARNWEARDEAVLAITGEVAGIDLVVNESG